MAYLDLLESNWEHLHSGTATAVTLQPYQLGHYYAIPDIVLPLLLSETILAISCESPSAKPSQRFAGKIKQKIRTGLTVGGNPDTINAAKSLWLNQISLIQFPTTAAEYSILISPYWKIRDINYGVWRYIGPVTNRYDGILNEILEAVT